MIKRLVAAAVSMAFAFMVFPAPPRFEGKKSDYHGYARYDFRLEGRDAVVIVPDDPLPGNPWMWRPAFFGAFPSIDDALLDAGFIIAYYDNTFEWARPEAMESGQKFYRLMVENHGLYPKPVMNGISRGGYYSLRRAQLYPETVSCLVLDNPLVDIFELRRDEEWWRDVKEKWEPSGRNPERGSFEENAAYNLDIPAMRHIPVLLLSGGLDTIVPYEKNGKLIVDTYRRYGAPVKSLVRPEAGHHPHGLDKAERVVPFIKKAACKEPLHTGKLKVACIGNSITEGVGTSDPSTKAYPAVLQKLLGKEFEVRNFGVSCSTALRKGTDSGQPFSWLGTARCREALDYQPDIVVIKLGGNDSKPDNWKYSDEFEQDYQEIIDSFKYLPTLPEIYVCLPAKARVDDPLQIWGIDEKVIAEEITPRILKIAFANRLPVIDLHDAYAGEENRCYSDNIHPTDRGAELIARKIFSKIRECSVFQHPFRINISE